VRKTGNMDKFNHIRPINVDQNKRREKDSRHLFCPVIGDVRRQKGDFVMTFFETTSLIAAVSSTIAAFGVYFLY